MRIEIFTFIFLDTVHLGPDDGGVILQPPGERMFRTESQNKAPRYSLEVNTWFTHLHRHGVRPVGVAKLLLLQRPHEPETVLIMIIIFIIDQHNGNLGTGLRMEV